MGVHDLSRAGSARRGSSLAGIRLKGLRWMQSACRFGE
jgi:hypothetical protein